MAQCWVCEYIVLLKNAPCRKSEIPISHPTRMTVPEGPPADWISSFGGWSLLLECAVVIANSSCKTAFLRCDGPLLKCEPGHIKIVHMPLRCSLKLLFRKIRLSRGQL